MSNSENLPHFDRATLLMPNYLGQVVEVEVRNLRAKYADGRAWLCRPKRCRKDRMVALAYGDVLRVRDANGAEWNLTRRAVGAEAVDPTRLWETV